MNERIKELAEQAGCIAFVDEYAPFKKDFEKFAELLVREMCQIINDDCELQYSKGVIINLGGLNQARELIKQHFGVKE